MLIESGTEVFENKNIDWSIRRDLSVDDNGKPRLTDVTVSASYLSADVTYTIDLIFRTDPIGPTTTKRQFIEQEEQALIHLGKTEIRKIIHTMKQASELL